MRTKHAAGDEGPWQHWHGARIPALDGLEGLCRRVLMMVCVCVWLSLHHGRSVNDVVFSKLWQTCGEDGPSFGSLHRESVWMEMQTSQRCCIPDNNIKYAGHEKKPNKNSSLDQPSSPTQTSSSCPSTWTFDLRGVQTFLLLPESYSAGFRAESCQSQGRHALKHTKFNCLLDTNGDDDLWSRHHVVLIMTSSNRLSP